MTICACCGKPRSRDNEPTCSNCGEASWLQSWPSKEPAIAVQKSTETPAQPKEAPDSSSVSSRKKTKRRSKAGDE